MKPYYAPNPYDITSGESYSESDGDDVSDLVEYITRNIFMDKGEGKAKSTLEPGRNAASGSGSISQDIKKGKDASRKSEKFPESNHITKVKPSKSVYASDDKSMSRRINLQLLKAGQLKVDRQNKVQPLQTQQKAAEANPLSRKRKPQTEHATPKQDLEAISQMTQTWTSKDELLLASNFLIDMKHGKAFPLRRGDHYWEELHLRLQGRLETDWSKDQIYDKYRRMKLSYDSLKERFSSDDTTLHKYKSAEEEKLFNVFNQLWGRQSVESKQKSGKSHGKCPTPCAEEGQSSSSSEDAAEEEGDHDHAIGDEEETSDEYEPEAEESALESAGKKSKLNKVSPQQELDHNLVIQNDAELSDHNAVLANLQLQSTISSSEEFENALEAVTLSLMEESQAKLLCIFKEEQAKTCALIEKLCKEQQAKTSAFIEKFVKELRWFSQLLMTSLPIENKCVVLPRLLEGFRESIDSEDSVCTSLLQQERL